MKEKQVLTELDEVIQALSPLVKHNREAERLQDKAIRERINVKKAVDRKEKQK